MKCGLDPHFSGTKQLSKSGRGSCNFPNLMDVRFLCTDFNTNNHISHTGRNAYAPVQLGGFISFHFCRHLHCWIKTAVHHEISESVRRTTREVALRCSTEYQYCTSTSTARAKTENRSDDKLISSYRRTTAGQGDRLFQLET